MSDVPQYALVVWRDSCEIGCVPFMEADHAVAQGRAILFAREDKENCRWGQGLMFTVDPAQSNPRRDDGED